MNIREYLKYLTNEAGEKEKEAFFELIQKDKELEREFLRVKRIWDISRMESINLPPSRKKQLFMEFWEKTHFENRKDKKQIFVRLLRYAAIFILLLAIPAVYFIGKKSVFSGNSFSTVTCAPGDKSFITLPDSSTVFLNAGSKLVFNTNFKNGERDVFLEGEAFFDVVKDPENPFRVKTPDVEIEVLGTKFNLKAYPDENIVSATLVEGSLKISADKQDVLLKPGQKLVFDKVVKKPALKKISDTSIETEWKDGRLVFRNESLADLELKLERWFDVDIVFADEEVKSRRFTGILERESILETISYFGYSKYVGYKIKGNEITFYSKN